MRSGLSQVEVLSARQHALITWRQLCESGLSSKQVSALVRRRFLRKARRGVYAIVGAPPTWEQALMAAVLSAGENAVASHAAAARLWRFAHRPIDAFELTLPRERRISLSSVRLHTSGLLTAQDVATRDGVPCTTFERTLCDCTTLLTAFQLGRTLDDGLRRGIASLRRLGNCLERLDSGPGRRLSVIKTLVDERGEGFNPGGSGSELRVLQVLRAAGLPEPVQQFEVRVDGQRYLADYAYPDLKAFIEYYGLNVHSGVSAVAHDNDRVSALSSVGWRPLIFTDATADHVIVRRTRALLEELGTLGRRLGA